MAELHELKVLVQGLAREAARKDWDGRQVYGTSGMFSAVEKAIKLTYTLAYAAGIAVGGDLGLAGDRPRDERCGDYPAPCNCDDPVTHDAAPEVPFGVCGNCLHPTARHGTGYVEIAGNNVMVMACLDCPRSACLINVVH